MALVLLADDDDILADLVQFRLEGDGHEVIVTDNGEDALKLVIEREPDLVILDCMMPVKNGIEVLRELRDRREGLGLPVMMLTSRKSEDDVVAALKLGANEYVTKPFRPQELAARVEALLRQAPSRDAHA